jgi:hypothetical protein
MTWIRVQTVPTADSNLKPCKYGPVSETTLILFCFLLPRELKEFAEKLRAEFEQEKRRAVNVATRSLERDLGQ